MYKIKYLNTFLLCFFILFLHTAEAAEKPIVKALIELKGPVCYAPQTYHDYLNKIGSFHSYPFIPVIGVKVLYKNVLKITDGNKKESKKNNIVLTESINWTKKEPITLPKNTLRLYIGNNNIGYYGNSFDKNKTEQLFPQYIPITLFYNKKEKDILSLHIYYYSVNLICTSQSLSNKERKNENNEKTFDIIFNEKIKIFTNYFSIYHPLQNGITEEDMKYFINNNIIESALELEFDHLYYSLFDKQYKDGENKFKNMETLMQKWSSLIFMIISKQTFFKSIIFIKLLYDHIVE